MQHRMKEFSMDREAVKGLLDRRPVGRISTNGADGYPYTVSVHFVRLGDFIYFHGLPAGEKYDNIKRDDRVCFEVSEFLRVTPPARREDVCTADSAYQSAVIRGRARLVEEPREKERALVRIVKKYFPDMKDYTMPRGRIAGTAVFRITPEKTSGKYH